MQNTYQPSTLSKGNLVRLGRNGLLTPTQWEVLTYSNRGLKVPQIAEAMGLSRKTVSGHLKTARRKQELLSRDKTRSQYYEDSDSMGYAETISPIFGNLYQSGIPKAIDVNRLRIDHIVNVSHHDNMLSHPSQLRIDLLDADKLPDRTVIGTAALFAARRAWLGEKVLIHCHMGMNRSGLIMGLALWFLTGWDGKRIVQTIRENRKWSLSNSTFREYLEDLPARDFSSLLAVQDMDLILPRIRDVLPVYQPKKSGVQWRFNQGIEIPNATGYSGFGEWWER